MEVRFQQGTPSKVWKVDIKDKNNKVVAVSVDLEGAQTTGITVEHKGTTALLNFNSAVTGSATITLEEGRSVYQKMFGEVINASNFR